MTFVIDERISSACFELGDWPLSRVFLNNNANYPWFILVPRAENIQEIDQLPKDCRHTLIEEISQLSTIARTYFKPDKLNVSTLGNRVPQLHIHIVARFKHDTLWPHGVWQAAQTITPYNEDRLKFLLPELCGLIRVAGVQPVNAK